MRHSIAPKLLIKIKVYQLFRELRNRSKQFFFLLKTTDTDQPKQVFTAETETLNKVKFMFLRITKRLLTNYKLEKYT